MNTHSHGTRFVRPRHDPHPKNGSYIADLDFAKRELLLRKIRRAMLPPSVSAEPAWAMLLELFEAGETSKPVRTMELIEAAGVPDATALRYLKGLEWHQLIERETAEFDRRVTLVRLTDEGARTLLLYSSMLKTVDRTKPEERSDLIESFRPKPQGGIFPWSRGSASDFLDGGPHLPVALEKRRARDER
jgi:DNA-binding MarR family transcriptional regulator